MKKLVAIALLVVAGSAGAHGYSRPPVYHHRPHHNHWNWVVPAIVGGAVVYAATRPAYTPPPQVIYVPAGYPPAPYGYRYEQVLDANCNCYRWVLVQN